MIASTVGPKHLRELFDIKASVFGGSRKTTHGDVFSSTNGAEILNKYFTNVAWVQFDDRLICTEERDVEAYMRSTPPGEDASVEELERLRAEITQRFISGDGTFEVTKDVGVFRAQRTQ